METSSLSLTKNYIDSSCSSSLSNKHQSALIFLGTGCSSTVPYARCLLQPSIPPCRTCSQSLSIPPEKNPNYRCNTSLLIDYCQSNDEHSYILIDVGKTFREQVLRWFTYYKIPRIDFIILTHEHADAVNGLVDLCAVEQLSPANDINPYPVYLTEHSMKSIALKFPYLVTEKPKVFQDVSKTTQLEWRIIESNCEKPFVASNLRFVPLPVKHGEDYISLGFLFGEKCHIAYISDVSRFPASTENVIFKTSGGQLDLLILDSNNKKAYTPGQEVSGGTHFSLPQALDTVKKFSPKLALLIGMNHNFEHHEDNEFLMEWSRREGICVQLAHDGLRIPIELQ